MSNYRLTPKFYTNPGVPPKPPVEKYTPPQKHNEDPMQKLRSANTVNISAELFEKVFLREARHTGLKDGHQHQRAQPRTFGDPTPIGYIGMVIGLTPLSCDLMGLLGADGGAAGIGSYYFFGGLLQILAGLGEWLLGNTFPSVFFTTFGAFFLSFAATLTPSFAAFATYAPEGEPSSAGMGTQAFNAGFGWFTLWMGVLSVVFFVCSLRTNVVLVVVFGALVGAFTSLTGAYFKFASAAARNAAAAASRASAVTGTVVQASGAAGLVASQTADNFVLAAGVCAFIASMAVWWLLLAVMLDTMDFPIALPRGDLSRWIKPRPAGRGEPRVYV
ncbi:hypothetical protein PpBr36_02686 [Pyricularia pennisetigena]|uniref:hypothetical protein n=1 Tax=Pyricularia pennisetigena TaxID=1578925 RepID=UPI001154033D|nr:hypothetical protein PpBr36_02686 [Pyricularia pennisetigena]TLS31350.1 hypothetical protein PpBr36_02686 [Pyricularia pennisetigena]